MNRRIFQCLSLLAAGLCLVDSVPRAAAKASNSAGTTAAEFLKLEPGARASAMGGAYTSVGNDAFSVYFNPASAAGFKGIQLAFERNEWFAGMNRNYGAVLYETQRYGILGASINWLGGDDMKRTTIASGQLGASTGTFSATDYAVAVSWANQFAEKFGAGISLKIIGSKIDNRSDQAFAADLGLRYRPLPNWNIGVSVSNLGSELRLAAENSELPLTFRAGTSVSLLRNRLLLSLDGFHHRNQDVEFAAGAEIALHRMISIRAGYNSLNADAGNGLTAGLGFHYENLALDYAYAPFDDLADAHRVSLQYDFEPRQEEGAVR